MSRILLLFIALLQLYGHGLDNRNNRSASGVGIYIRVHIHTRKEELSITREEKRKVRRTTAGWPCVQAARVPLSRAGASCIYTESSARGGACFKEEDGNESSRRRV